MNGLKFPTWFALVSHLVDFALACIHGLILLDIRLKLLNFLTTDFTVFISSHAKPLHCTCFMNKSEVAFAAALHFQHISFLQFIKTDSANCFLFRNFLVLFRSRRGTEYEGVKLDADATGREVHLFQGRAAKKLGTTGLPGAVLESELRREHLSLSVGKTFFFLKLTPKASRARAPEELVGTLAPYNKLSIT
ncbi:hypothetical protein Leryth_002652 [Lithospermum erythrorhizon]|nr:hypothetical protein Leryth_002652 [Lithospermum erythrorhizon]